MSNLVKLENENLELLETSRAEQIKNTFEPMVKMLEDFENEYNSVIKLASKEITVDVQKLAIDLFKRMNKVKIATEKVRKEQKASIVIAGKAIDGTANILKYAISDKLEKLQGIKNYFEEQEKARLEKLQDARVKLLQPYLDNADEIVFSDMAQDVFDAYLQVKKENHLKAIEEEKEKIRIAKEEEEKERLRILEIEKENERVKKQLEKERIERELKEKAEQKKRNELAEKERIERERLEKERIEKENKARLERERLAKIESDKLEKERIEKEKLAKELQDKKDAEIKRLAKIESDKQTELNKGDVDKINDLITDLKNIKTKFAFKSKLNQKLFSAVCVLIDKVVKYINENKG